ncbi:MAG: hypothetical protein LUC93_03085 [Planctomycetaceae bacterium]|nr:hypothetical protein [Planctomycetaceae bacterium]
MMQLKVIGNLVQAIALCQQLGATIEPEIAKSLNRASHGVKTDVVRTVAKKGIKREELSDWSFQSARPGSVNAKAIIRGQRLGLEKFSPSPFTKMQGHTPNRSGVTVKLLDKPVTFRHAFVNDIYTADLAIWQRKRGATPKVKFYEKGGVRKRLKGRFPLTKLTFLAVPQMADDDDVLEIVVKNAEERYLKQLDHLLDKLTKDFS